jgi:multiple sugar transport system permease protein
MTTVPDFVYAADRLPLSALRRRQIAALGWTWVVMLTLGIVFLGTFVIAFLASLKNDPLESPFRFIFPQVNPAAWVAAADLGSQAGGGALWGGFTPEADVTFTVTYAVDEGEVAEPEVEVPRRVPGSGVAAAITRDFASDYAQVEFLGREDFVIEGEEGVGINAATFTYRITYPTTAGATSPDIRTLPFTATVPARQDLLDSSLPVTQMERRGRTASWDNIAPGALGLIFDNYRRLANEVVDLSSGDRLLGYWMLQSFLIGLGRVILVVTLASLAGYALARMKFRGKEAIFALVIFSMTIPAQVTFISNYLVIRDINLLNTVWGVIIVFTFSAHVLLMKQFFEGFPKDIEEAATIDGASRFQTLTRIVLPNARPALMTNAIMAFQGAWNDFFWPFILITSPPQNLTIQVGLSGLRQQYGAGEGDWGLVLAGAFISIVPMVIMFIIFQRYIVATNVSEGVK